MEFRLKEVNSAGKGTKFGTKGMTCEEETMKYAMHYSPASALGSEGACETTWADACFSKLRRILTANMNGMKLRHPKYRRHRAAATVIAPSGGRRQMCCPIS